jgi:hypothetical protein
MLERLSPFHNSAASITGMNVLRHSNFCPDRLLAKDKHAAVCRTYTSIMDLSVEWPGDAVYLTIRCVQNVYRGLSSEVK